MYFIYDKKSMNIHSMFERLAVTLKINNYLTDEMTSFCDDENLFICFSSFLQSFPSHSPWLVTSALLSWMRLTLDCPLNKHAQTFNYIHIKACSHRQLNVLYSFCSYVKLKLSWNFKINHISLNYFSNAKKSQQSDISPFSLQPLNWPCLFHMLISPSPFKPTSGP